MIPRPFRTLVLLFTLLAGCVAAKNQDSTPTPDQTSQASPEASAAAAGPTATATISLTPPPNATPADPAAAHRFESEGDYQHALDAYLSISASNASNKADGVYGAARVLLQMERPADARTLLEPFIASATPAAAAPAHYLLARAYTALSMFNEALSEYNLYIQSGRPATVYAYLDRARILMDQGQPSTAAAEAQRGLDVVPKAAQRTFVLIAAQSYEKAGDFANALTWYQKLYDTSPGDQPLALQRMSAIKQIQGGDYISDLQKLMANFPSTQAALDTLKDFQTKGIAVDAFVKGLVYYRHNDYDSAEPFFQAQIGAAPNDASSAGAYYYEAAILESKDKIPDAEADYAKVVTLDPNNNTTLADDALWWRGRLLEADGDLTGAATLFARIVSDFPSSSWAADAAFRRGELSYHSGKYQEAAGIWADGLKAVSDPTEVQRLTFWQGKALLKAGDKAGSQPILQGLATSGEDDYYGVRALGLMNGSSNEPSAPTDSKANLTPNFDWAGAETWLAGKIGSP
ncbi:MAG TPA: tetratricopeptide repeat protein, partial [Dehalococcoidia bacterium]